MNTLKPLAAAFLLLASSASAQLLGGTNSSTGGGFSATSGNGGYFNPASFANTAGNGPIPDASFTCSSMDNAHIPFAPCTETQLADRKRFSGECPSKSTACKEYLQRQLSGSNPAATIAAYDPPPGRGWKSPDCQRIPCALADEPTTVEEIVVTAPRRSAVPGDADFIGPVQDSAGSQLGGNLAATSAPTPPVTEATFQSAFAAARETHGDKAIDLGNKSFGILNDEDGTITVVGPNGTSKKNQSEYKDKIQQARAENFAYNNNGATPPANAGSNKASGQTSGGTPPPAADSDDSGSTGSGSGLGRSFASDQASISGSGAGGDSSSNGSDDGAFKGDGKGYIAVKQGEMKSVDEIEITHTGLLRTQSLISGAQRAVQSGQTDLATADDDTGSDAKGPPISPEHLGKIQAVGNGPASE